MPIIFNQRAFPHAVGPDSEMSFDEPGQGNEDVPQTATQFNWTVFCEANGNPLQREHQPRRRLHPRPGRLDAG